MFSFSSLPSISSLNFFAKKSNSEQNIAASVKEEASPLATSTPSLSPVDFDDYVELQNDEEFATLDVIANSTSLPIETRKLSQYVDVPTNKIKINKSCNNTLTKQKIKADGTSSLYIFKQINASPDIAIDSPMYELEAFFSACFYWAMPGQAPKAHPVANDDTDKMEYIAIKVINPLRTFKDENPTEEQLNEILKNEIQVERIITAKVVSDWGEDDDSHRGNFSIDGIRIDFDMALWTVTWMFKKSNIWEQLLKIRRPLKGFRYTADDIRAFPSFADDDERQNPVYSPGRDLKDNYIKIACCFASTQNPYTEVEQKFFRQLGAPQYRKYIFKTLLKLIMVDREFYLKLAQRYIRTNIPVPSTGKSLIETIADKYEEKIKNLRRELMTMHEFHTFLNTDGDKALQKIKAEIKYTNAQFYKRAKRALEKRHDSRYYQYDNCLSENEIDKRYIAILKEAQDKHDELVKEGEHEAVMVPKEDPHAEEQYDHALAQSFCHISHQADPDYLMKLRNNMR